jgi:hypothetical protein
MRSSTTLDLLAWTRLLLLEGELAAAEPKKLRYRLLHAAARIARGGRRMHLRIAAPWPWRNELTSAPPEAKRGGQVPASRSPPPGGPLRATRWPDDM